MNSLLTRQKLLRIVSNDVAVCTKCKLHTGRTNTVFGSGNVEAELMVIGEAAGAEEDRQGLPFVGRAGKLLTNMLKSIGYEREDVYICNVNKCRPPNNRKPEPDEVKACIDYLWMQIEVISPICVIALGATATEALLGPGPGILKRRGQRYECPRITSHGDDSISVYPTIHPSGLLRNPSWKALAWEDMQLVKKFMDEWKAFISGDQDMDAVEKETRDLKEKRKTALREEERKLSRHDKS